MPAAVFNPLAAVIVHSQVPVNPLTFQLLEGEDALLIHSCPRRATRQEWIRWNKNGKMIVFVRHSPRLTYNVTATALDPTGENLGNYHPGRCLGDRTLAFLNGTRVPFQFDITAASKLILKEPSQEPGAGDSTEVSFEIEHAFIDLDVENYPGGSVATPSEPELFITLPEQSVADLTAEALEALIEVAFLNADPFAGEPLTLTLYYGDPAGSGIAVSDPLALTNWTNVDEPDIPTRSRVRNHAVLDFLDASGLDRTVTHLLWARNGVPVSRKELSAPVVIPGYYGLRIPVNALALQLTWPAAGDVAGSWVGPATWRAFAFLFGSEDLQPAQTTLYLNFYDGDPHTTGNAIGDNDLTLDRSVAGWTAAGSTATSAAGVSGTDTAPPGGWTIPFAVVGIDGAQMWCIVKEFDPPLFVPEGASISLSAGAFDVTISSP